MQMPVPILLFVGVGVGVRETQLMIWRTVERVVSEPTKAKDTITKAKGKNNNTGCLTHALSRTIFR